MRVGAGLFELALQLRFIGAVVRLAFDVAFPPKRPVCRTGKLGLAFQKLKPQAQGLAHVLQSAHVLDYSKDVARIQPLALVFASQVSGLVHGLEHPVEAHRLKIVLAQSLAEVHQAGGVEGRLVGVHAQGQLPAQIKGAVFGRLAVGNAFHELQQRGPEHPHRLFAWAPVVGAVHNFEPRAQALEHG